MPGPCCRLLLVLGYDQKTGSLGFFAYDSAAGTSFFADYTAGAGESFTQTRIGTEFGPDPWTAPSTYTHPAAWTKIAVYTGVRLQTYNGKLSTLASWFPHHKIFMSAITGALLDVQAAPTDLAGGGASFQDWLAPRRERSRAASAGISGRPPRWSGTAVSPGQHFPRQQSRLSCRERAHG